MEKTEERQHALTEIEAEISAMREEPAPDGASKRALKAQVEYYKNILDLYAEKENIIRKGIDSMRKEKIASSEWAFRKMFPWG